MRARALEVDYFVQFFRNGGFFMWPILACAVFAAAISFERLYYILFRASVNATAFMAQLQRLVMGGNIDRAIKLCNSEPHAALPRVLKAALARANQGEKELQDGVDEAILDVFPQLNKRTNYLPMLANVSTLLGLLGTVQGLIVAFEAVARATAESKQSLLANGIAIAMNTTAFGLLIAIPTLILHSLIFNRTTRIMDDIDQYSLRTANLLAQWRKGQARASSAEGTLADPAPSVGGSVRPEAQ